MATPPEYMPQTLDQAVGKLVEECGELQAALGKTLRWGWDGVNPELSPMERETNEMWVDREMRDVREAMRILNEFLSEREC